jgi:putative ABC transport system permease protein
MQTLLSDIKYAFRMLIKNPGFTCVGVIALALGTGVNTAIFSVVNAVLIRQLPFPTASRLVAVDSYNSKRGADSGGSASYPDFHDLRAANHSFENMTGYHYESWSLTGSGRAPENLNVATVSAGMFPMLGVDPMMGRVFRKEEDEDKTGPMSVVISQGAWKKYFSSDPDILGKQIILRRQPYTVIGVMPAGFTFPIANEALDAWTTFGFSPDLRSADGTPAMGAQRGAHFFSIAGVLKPGVSVTQAKADLDVIDAQLSLRYPESNRYRAIRIAPLLDKLVAKLRPFLLILLCAVGCVLLVACANVANLLLARSSARSRELAIRTALGASRMRVVRQTLTESVLLSLMGGAVGLLLASWGSALLVKYGPQDVPRLGDAHLDWPVFAFAVGVSLASGVLFGMLPALRAAQSDPAETLKEGSRGSTEGLRSNKARSVLVVAEVALAFMLLSSAGLLIRSLDKLSHSQPGFVAEGVLTASITLPETRFTNPQVLHALQLIESRLTQTPGVKSAADVVILPMSGDDMNTSLEVEGHPMPVSERQSTRINIASASYFKTMGIPFLSGRDFSPTDTEKSNAVVVVNQAFARQFFPNENPIGKRVKPGFSRGTGTAPMREIVGVVGSVAQDRVGQKPLPELFLPRDQFVNSATTLVIRTAGDPNSVTPALRAILRDIDPDLPIDVLRTMDQRMSLSLAQPRFQSYLLLIFAGVALLLTAVGLYGVISYSVSQRTHEIGTRMALGARQGSIVKLVVAQGMVLASIGALIGLAGALAASQLLTSLLYEISPTDPLTLAAITGLVFLVTFLASYVPARRASNVDPMTALRYE